MNLKKQKDNVELSKEEKERLELLQKADEVASKGQQLKIDVSGEVVSENELNELIFKDTDNPEEKYKLYYDGISKLLKQNLPSGKTFEKARQIIFDEKNIYLTRGKKKDSNGVRGADSRMGYLSDLEELMKATIKWVVAKGTMTDLYEVYWNLNEEKGYPHQTDIKFDGGVLDE